jgi:hypothetical protein
MPESYVQLRERYLKKHGRLVKPVQGWESLAMSLWLPYSMGIKRGYYDVGTYVNKPGDHGGTRTERHPPAWAFDLRRKGWLGRFGWGYRNARKLANFYWKHHKALSIEYVIVGRQVISREKPYWHDLGNPDTSHDWHIHVSGHWPGR